MPVTLRDYQIDTIEAIVRDFAAGKRDVLAKLATGGGKTTIGLELIQRLRTPGSRALWIAHRQELIDQPVERFRQMYPAHAEDIGVVMGRRNECAAPIVVATIQTLRSAARIAQITASGPIDIAVLDECFPPATPIRCADGTTKPIAEVAVGDRVASYDVAAGRFVAGEVMAVYQRTAATLVRLTLAGRPDLVCTPNHPIMTRRGWLAASLVRAGDEVLTSDGVTPGDLLPLWRGGDADRQGEDRHLPPVGADVLRRGLQGGDAARRVVAADGGDEPALRGGADARPEPDVRPREAAAGLGVAARDRPRAAGARREWDRADRAPGGAVHEPGAGLGDGGRGRDRRARRQSGPDRAQLQDRFSPPPVHAGGRGRRAEPLLAPGRGRQEDARPHYARVDRVAVYEQAGDDADGGGRRAHRVHNFAVRGTHTYVAGGVVVHNCHHATAPTYQDVLGHLRHLNPALRHVGFTATPKRADGDGLIRVYQSVAASYGLVELIRGGWLVPFTGYRIRTGINLRGVKTSHGDYQQGDLARVMDVDNAFDLVVQAHADYCHGRQAIAFTVGVTGAYRLAEKFRQAGYRAIACDGTTPKDATAGFDPRTPRGYPGNRRDILEAVRAGALDVLCNCNVFTEGVDLPMLSAVHWCRPTTSGTVYSQGVGRGFRPHPGKTDCLILDYVTEGDLDIVQSGDLLGQPKEERKAQLQAEKAGVVLQAIDFSSDATGLVGSGLVAERLGILALSPYAWFQYVDAARGGELSTLGLGTKHELDGATGTTYEVERVLALTRRMDDGLYRLLALARTRGNQVVPASEEVVVLARSADFNTLQLTGVEYAERHAVPGIARRDQAWQQRPATQKQRLALARFFPDGIPVGDGTARPVATLRAGEAMRLLTHMAAREQIARYARRVAAGARR